MREGLHKVVCSDDTIVAISTPFGRSAIGVARVSGPGVTRIAAELFQAPVALAHRSALLGRWLDRDGSDGEVVDEVVVTFYQGPRSYTGEDLLEISAHGNPFILHRILRSVQSAGARVAGPGEFTLRAVAHGKMDLLQAEAVRDFIDAQTADQARMALRQMEGGLSKRIGPLKERLIDVIARAEAGIDFVEDDLDPPDGAAIVKTVEEIARDLTALEETFAYGRLLNRGLRLVIAGKPNVGKSSLFNRLVSADRAIVTDTPGTTRDVLTETVNVDGIPLVFFDTAGIHETIDPVESIGVLRSKEALAEADLALVVLDGSAPSGEDDEKVLSSARRLPCVVVVNKCDLPQRIELDSLAGNRVVRLSARTGAGMADLEVAFREFLAERGSGSSADAILTNARQQEAVMRAIRSLEAGARAVSSGTPHEMALLDFYEALTALGELTGDVSTDDILGRIFTTFCIGK